MKCHQTVITAKYDQTGFMARGDRGYGSGLYIKLYKGYRLYLNKIQKW